MLQTLSLLTQKLFLVLFFNLVFDMAMSSIGLPKSVSGGTQELEESAHSLRVIF